MSDAPLPNSEIILYQTEDGRTRVQCRFENETVWLTQALLAELYECSADNVGLHLQNIFADREMHEPSVTEESSVGRLEGAREVTRNVTFTGVACFIIRSRNCGVKVPCGSESQLRRNWTTFHVIDPRVDSIRKTSHFPAVRSATTTIENRRRADRERIERHQRSQMPLTLEQWIGQLRLFEKVASESTPHRRWWQLLFAWRR